jgi:DNA-binding NarL/FixJ family response regulator
MWSGIKSLLASASDKPRPSVTPFLREDRSSAAPYIMIVALLAVDQDRWSLASICCREQWGVHFASTCEEAREAAHQLKASVILCDRDLLGTPWRDVMRMLASSPHGARVILISKVVDDSLWNEVGRIGGHDVLCKPLQDDHLVRAVTLAWSYWNSRFGEDSLPGKRPWLWSVFRR